VSTPIVDVTTLVGVESLFRDGPRDPWALTLAGRLADLYIYSDVLRYVLPTASAATQSDLSASTFELVTRLQDAHPGAFEPLPFPTDALPVLRQEYVLGVYDQFDLWTRANSDTFVHWLALHRQGWVIEEHNLRLERPVVLPIDHLRQQRDVTASARRLNIKDEEDILYSVDVVLRYSLYGALAEGNFYLNHPIRDIFPIPTAEYEPASPPNVCVSFARDAKILASRRSLADFVQLLKDLRTMTRDSGLHMLRPGNVDVKTVREIASKARLTPYLKRFAMTTTALTGAVGVLGVFTPLGPGAAFSGGLVTASTAIWDGRLPRMAAQYPWLRWAIRWPVEDQAEPRH
jgi:hypothetical protein